MDNKVSAREGNQFLLLEDALEQKRLRIQHGILQWVAGSQPRLQWRQPGRTPYQVFIGEFLLSHTSPEIAASIYSEFLRKFPSLHELRKAGEKSVAAVLKHLGVHVHAGCLMAAGSDLFTDKCQELPADSESMCRLTELTAAGIQAIFCFGYNLPLSVVDENAARMLTRLFQKALPSVAKHGLLQSVAEALLPYYNPQEFNRGFLELAETVCTREAPHCLECPLVEICDFAGGTDSPNEDSKKQDSDESRNRKSAQLLLR
ncbi:MAG TPA: hypothetical protein VEI27_02385 [Dehalococcoidales bacterium]|nr:hypothetical protein [Dehalococcoidales bacterium]